MTTLPLTLNNISIFHAHTLSPEDWVDNYCDEFFKKVFLLTNDHFVALQILATTFAKGIVMLDDYRGTLDERSWLLNLLNIEICEKLNMVYVMDNCNLTIQNCLKGMSHIQQEVFELKTFQKEKTKNICKKLKISEKQFWVYIHNARILLNDCL